METVCFLFLCCCSLLFCTVMSVPVSLKTVFARPGDEVVLSFRYTPCSTGQLTAEWSFVDGSAERTVLVLRQGTELPGDKDPAYKDRTAAEGNCFLKFKNVQLQDNGTYSCVLLRQSKQEHKVSISLIIALESQVNVSNEMDLVRFESSGWNPKPQVALLDSLGKDLQAHPEFREEQDGLFAFRVTFNVSDATALPENRTIICRVEVPEMRLVKDTSIYVPASQNRNKIPSNSSWVVAVVLVVLVTVVVWMLWRKELLSFLKCHIVEIFTTSRRLRGAGFEDIMEIKTSGANGIAKSNHLSITGVDASHELARRDLEEMQKYTDIIHIVGERHVIHPALIAAIISRQSQAGKNLRPDGFGRFDTNCFGLMQIHKDYHDLKGGPFSEDHVDQGVEHLAWLIGKMKNTWKSWSIEKQLKGALAAYMVGIETVNAFSGEDVDTLTPYEDFVNDVIARAQWFSSNGFNISGPPPSPLVPGT